MIKVKTQGTLVLPFQRIEELLGTLDTDKNQFNIARDIVTERMSEDSGKISLNSIDFEVSGNRITVTCLTSGPGVKGTFKHSFDTVYAVMSELLTFSLRDTDIENEDTLMAVRDMTIVEVE